jgi:hypothetical protein
MFFGPLRAGFRFPALAQASARTQFFATAYGDVSSLRNCGDLGQMAFRPLLFKGAANFIFSVLACSEGCPDLDNAALG